MTRTTSRRRLVGVLGALCLLVGLGSLALALSAPVRLLSPKAGAVLKGTAIVQGSVSGSGVTFVILGIDGRRAFSTNSSPYSFSLDTTELADGPHTLVLEAYGRGGMIGSSSAVRVLVKNAAARSVPAQIAPALQVRAPGHGVRVAKHATPAAPSKVADSPATPGTMPLALTAEPQMTAQAVSLPPAIRPTPKALTSEPSAVAAPSETAALRPASSEPRLSPAAVASVPPSPAPGRQDITVVVNGQPLLLDSALRTSRGGLDVGFRKVMTAAGWKVVWVPSRRAGAAETTGHVLEIVLGKDEVIVDGKVLPLGRKVAIANDRLLVALRPLCQAAGITLTWDEKTRTASLTSPHAPCTTVASAK